jgi:hypothetical protein
LIWNFWRFQRLKGSLPGQARSSRVLLPHNWSSSYHTLLFWGEEYLLCYCTSHKVQRSSVILWFDLPVYVVHYCQY